MHLSIRKTITFNVEESDMEKEHMFFHIIEMDGDGPRLYVLFAYKLMHYFNKTGS